MPLLIAVRVTGDSYLCTVPDGHRAPMTRCRFGVIACAEPIRRTNLNGNYGEDNWSNFSRCHLQGNNIPDEGNLCSETIRFESVSLRLF